MSEEDNIQVEESDAEEAESLEFPIEYNITSSPNDFNIKTLYDFTESGIVEIPSFQRNYVWDIKRASKLIESIIMGLPVPQIFLYEKSKNKFMVVDGQQRLMTIYYFILKRFPKMNKRLELRKILDTNGIIPKNVFLDNAYFEDFNLELPKNNSGTPNRLNTLTYDTITTEDQTTFQLRTIRSIIIRQHSPKGESSIFEIFYRLNTGGINLKPQEIRTCLYHSDFYKRLYKLNLDQRWRKITNQPQPDLHMKDIEIILRGFAMLINGNQYSPSMTKFINNFSEESDSFSEPKTEYLEKLFIAFLEKAYSEEFRFYISQQNKFNVSMYEAIFTIMCENAYKHNNFNVLDIDSEKIKNLRNDTDFKNTTLQQTTNTANVKKRLERARLILTS